MNHSQPLFSQSEILKLPEIAEAGGAPVQALLDRIKEHLVTEIGRCVQHCPPKHLAHLALGSQQLGVVIRKDCSSFSVRFVRDLDKGMSDPFEPRARSEFLLSDIPAIASADDAWDLIEEMANLAGLNKFEWEKLLLRTMRIETRLAKLMSNAHVLDEVRRRVSAEFESSFLPTLHDVPDFILCSTCDRLLDEAWFKERRRLKAKENRLARAQLA